MRHQKLPRTFAVVASDRGSAPIEFIFASIVLLIPLVYLVLSLGQVQAGSYATQSTAINAARAAARYPDSADVRAEAMARLHFEDFGVDGARWSIRIECSGPCDEAGSTVTAHVETRVPVLGLPALFGRDSAPHVTVRASHSDIVSPYTASASTMSANTATSTASVRTDESVFAETVCADNVFADNVFADNVFAHGASADAEFSDTGCANAVSPNSSTAGR